MPNHERVTSTQGDTGSTADMVGRYYRNSPGYLDGSFKGTCHFGFTPEGQEFELGSALRAMEMRLGEALALPPGSTVLDAGCGFGRVATTLNKEFGLKITGIDLLYERLTEAKRYTGNHGVSAEVNLLNGNYCTIPLPESSVDGIFTMETLVHADPLESALNEFRRILKPGGHLALFEYTVPDRTTLDPLRKCITDIFVQRIAMASVERFTPGAFPGILQKAGFENIQVEDISRNVWPTWRWMFCTGIKWLPKMLKGQIIEDKTNWTAALLIWPYRHFLGYSVVTANKPS